MERIDIVYLWVDGNDPEWQARKNRALGIAEMPDKQVAARCRFCDNDELKYSLRSLERCAPWINRVFIVTDDQTPSWLDTSNPKVRIVSHSQIIPERYRPQFNSAAIELFLTQIPDLSERFLLANDDTLFNEPVDPAFFYTPQGLPIVRLMRRNSDGNGMYDRTILYSQSLVRGLTGRYYPHAPHHNIDAYLKSTVEECMNVFQKQVEATRNHHFRDCNDFTRSAFAYYALATRRAKIKLIHHCDGEPNIVKKIIREFRGDFKTDSRLIPIYRDVAERMARYNPTLFCVNDNEKATDDDRRRMKAYLESRFAEKSSFEK